MDERLLLAYIERERDKIHRLTNDMIVERIKFLVQLDGEETLEVSKTTFEAIATNDTAFNYEVVDRKLTANAIGDMTLVLTVDAHGYFDFANA